MHGTFFCMTEDAWPSTRRCRSSRWPPLDAALSAAAPVGLGISPALLNAADPKASLAERQLWLVRLMEWLRRAPLDGRRAQHATAVLRLQAPAQRAAAPPTRAAVARCWRALARGRHRRAVRGLRLRAAHQLLGRLGQLRLRLLPITPGDAGSRRAVRAAVPTMRDAQWLAAIDDETTARLAAAARPVAARAGPEARRWSRHRLAEPAGARLRATRRAAPAHERGRSPTNRSASSPAPRTRWRSGAGWRHGARCRRRLLRAACSTPAAPPRQRAHGASGRFGVSVGHRVPGSTSCGALRCASRRCSTACRAAARRASCCA